MNFQSNIKAIHEWYERYEQVYELRVYRDTDGTFFSTTTDVDIPDGGIIAREAILGAITRKSLLDHQRGQAIGRRLEKIEVKARLAQNPI